MAKLIIFKNPYNTEEALENVVNYINNRNKSDYIGAQNLLLTDPLSQIQKTNKYWYKETQKKIIHFALSFNDYEYIQPYTLYELGYKICEILSEYQIVFAVHNNTEHQHIHFALNPLNILTGKKFNFNDANLFTFINKLRNLFETFDMKVGYNFNMINMF